MSEHLPVELVEGNDWRNAEIRWLMMPAAVEPPHLEDLIERPAWMARAACRGEPHATFFLGLGGSPKRGKALCAGCPVRDECFSYAMADPDLVGWRAGTSEQERARMRRAA